MEDVRKTIRFPKEDFDNIMSDEDLRDIGNYGFIADTNFSVRFRNLIRRYFWQKKRIQDLAVQLQTMSDNYAEMSDKLDQFTSKVTGRNSSV